MSVADRVWQELAAYHDQDPDGILRGLIEGLCAPFEIVDQIASEQDDGTSPYGLLTDINNVPDVLLPYAGAYAGVRDRGQTREALRAEIRDRPRFRRGTPGSIISAAQTVLTGAKTVRLLEQSSGPYVATIVTRTAETPETDYLQPVNLIVNPSFELSASTGWGAGWAGAAASLSTTGAITGTNAVHLLSTSMGPGGQNTKQALGPDSSVIPDAWPVTAGQQYSAEATFTLVQRVGNALARVQVHWYNAAGVFLSAAVGNSITAIGTGVSRTTPTAPVGAAWAQVTIVAYEGTPNPPAGLIEAYVDRVLFAEGDVQYADGDTPGWEWTGTPHNSASERILTTLVLDAIRAADVKPYGIRLDHEISDLPLIAEGTLTINAVAETIDDATLGDVT